MTVLAGLPAAASAAGQAGVPTFHRDVAPVLSAHCAPCHAPGGAAPFSLQSFDEVRRRGRLIVEATRTRYMPPWKPVAGFGGPFTGERHLSDAEIGTLARWVAAGMPEGEATAAARPATVPATAAARAAARPATAAATEPGTSAADVKSAVRRIWTLGTPDLIVTMPTAYELGAEGPDAFRTFAVPVPVRDEKFVAAVEFRPGGSGVHHANLRFDATKGSRELDADDPLPGYEGPLGVGARYPDGYFFGWTPGQSPLVSAAGMAWRLAPGTDLVLQLHLRRTGKPELVQPSVAFYFTADAPQRTPLALRLGRQNIDIAPGTTFIATDSYRLPVDVELLAIHPHAHYRAREIRATADLPDGTRRWLLRIDDWDFNWQDVYRYASPVALPRGTTITMAYTYDNTAANPRNPDRPPRRVVFGQNSSDEMGDLWLQVVTTTEADRTALYADFRPKALREDIAGYEMLVAAQPSHAGYRSDLAFLHASFGEIDEAIAQFEAAARLKPEWPAAHYNLATLLAATGRLDEAAAQFRHAIALRPGHAESHNNLGAVLQAQGLVDAAIEAFGRAVALDPGNEQARVNLARAVESRK